MNKSHLLAAACTCLAAISFNANAALVARDLDGNLATAEAYYDNVADLTWLADANAAGTTMDWLTANSWAAGLDINGVTGWRLPVTLQPDPTCSSQNTLNGASSGSNCTGSEMGNLFYNVLGGTSGGAISATHNANYYLFSNIQDSGYWSATAFAPNPNNTTSWVFSFGIGGQEVSSNGAGHYAWAVQSGDVGAAVVPIPAAAWLFGSGLLGLIGVGRHKKA